MFGVESKHGPDSSALFKQVIRIYIYTYIYILYIYTYVQMHACMHYITLPCLTLPYVTSRTLITLHYNTLHYTALHCTALHCIALHCIHTWTPKYMYILPFNWCVHLKWFPAHQKTYTLIQVKTAGWRVGSSRVAQCLGNSSAARQRCDVWQKEDCWKNFRWMPFFE